MKFLTFCLFFMISLSTQATGFKSPVLNSFYQSVNKIDALGLGDLAKCSVFHRGNDILTEANRTLEYRVYSSKGLSEQDIKPVIASLEKKDSRFWLATETEIDVKKLMSKSEVSVSGIFGDSVDIFDNLYCFAYAGADYQDLPDRKKMVEAISKTEGKVEVYVYYDDGGEEQEGSKVLIAYLVDKEQDEVYAIKSYEK